MTIDTNALRALCDAATPGPWGVSGGETVFHDPDPTGGAGAVQQIATAYGGNAEFTAAARTALPELLDEREEWLARIDECEASYSRAMNVITREAGLKRDLERKLEKAREYLVAFAGEGANKGLDALLAEMSS